MTTKTQLTVIETAEDAKTFLLDPVKARAWIEEYKADILNTVVNSDMSVKKNRDEIRSLAASIPRRKTQIDGWGKSLVEPLKKQAKAIDAVRKLFKDELDELRDIVRKPLTEYEEKEKERKEAMAKAISDIADLCLPLEDGGTLETLQDRMVKLEQVDLNPELWGEFYEEAKDTYGTTVTKLKAIIADREKYEAEQAELAELRALKEKQEREERERKIAEEAKAKAEAQAKEAAEKAERDRIAAEERAKKLEQEAIAAAEEARKAEELRIKQQHEAEEQRKRDAEAAEKAANEAAAKAAREAEAKAKREAREAEQQRIAEEAQRKANQEHASNILGAIKTAIMDYGVDEATARAIVLGMKNNNIPHVKVLF